MFEYNCGVPRKAPVLLVYCGVAVLELCCTRNLLYTTLISLHSTAVYLLHYVLNCSVMQRRQPYCDRLPLATVCGCPCPFCPPLVSPSHILLQITFSVARRCRSPLVVRIWRVCR